jgi:acetoin:2,6-dichlorophenolindophenol oxidoreductase subunit alpha
VDQPPRWFFNRAVKGACSTFFRSFFQESLGLSKRPHKNTSLKNPTHREGMMKYATELLEHLYRTMVRIRVCEESLVEPIIAGEIRCPCHLCTGQEAISAGICASLREDDYIFGNHRSHGHYLAKGGGMFELVAEIYGREAGCSRGRGGSMHLIDPGRGILGAAPIVAGTISLAMGAALTSLIRQDERVAVAFFGDGATGEGVLYECLNFAALKNLPLIFVCENNFYATHMPIRECRTTINIHKVGEPFAIPSFVVDGNDVLEVYDIGKFAVERCRAGRGPVFLECRTYRLRGHVGPDDNIQGQHTDIRPPAEVEYWRQKDPIARFEDFLLTTGLMDRKTLDAILREADEEVALAHAFARHSPPPDRKDVAAYVFQEKIAL